MQISSIASTTGWIIHSHMWLTCSQDNIYNTFSLCGESFFWTAVSWARRNHNCLNMDLIQLSFASRDLIPYGVHLGFPNRFFPNLSPVICIRYVSSWLETTASFNHLFQGLFFCFGRNSPPGKRYSCFFGLFPTYAEYLALGELKVWFSGGWINCFVNGIFCDICEIIVERNVKSQSWNTAKIRLKELPWGPSLAVLDEFI